MAAYLLLLLQLFGFGQPQTTFDTNYLLGKFEPAQHADFVAIDRKYRVNRPMYLRKDAYEAFVKMHEAAKKAGVTLTITSATRNFDYQKKLWEDKWNGKTILEDGTRATAIPDATDRARKLLQYSAMPGSSRHHWGTDFDINALSNAYYQTGKGKKIYAWLEKNAYKYGFCQPYSAMGAHRSTGYHEERWHWSYYPISIQLTNLSSILLRDENFVGFNGCETAAAIGIVKNYVLGIDASCR